MSFTIKELETLSGIKAHTIRIWEQRYHFIKPSRTSTNIRTYSNEELKTLLSVALLNKYGYKISQINKMPEDERNRQILNIPSEEVKTEWLVNRLIGCMIDLKTAEFEHLLDQHISEKGISATLKEIIFFFLNKIGILWQTGKIHPAHEHIVTNIVRQKIVSAIEGLKIPIQDEPKFLLLLPEDEHHELGLLFVYYMLKQKQIPVLYLGASVPLKDADFITNHKKPDYIYIHLTSVRSITSFKKFISGISSNYPQVQILLSGSAASVIKEKPENLRVFNSLPEVSAFIDSIKFV
jgi:MerR family transcriptional regulator, light-induced transcriptional regulator